MAFTEAQVKNLEAKLSAKRIKTRQANGITLAYVEGWHVIAEANRIFGHDAWDRRTRTNNCVWTATKGEFYHAAYTAKVRVSVRAGDTTIVREGSGTGEGKALTPGQAHELALKGAETDATKRALATFGNPFGLALYDRERTGVRQNSKAKAALTEPVPQGPWAIRAGGRGVKGSFAKPDDFVGALRDAMTEARDIERLFEIWEQNVAIVRELNASREKLGLKPGFAPSLVAHLKDCAVALVKPSGEATEGHIEGAVADASKARLRIEERPKIDKSLLTIGEPKRIRSKEHLRFVARQPCLVCGRTPSHAHHVRYAQSRGLALKVSDEFTVPLCAIHHTENHATGDERKWWSDRKIDPLAVAQELWKSTTRLEKPAG